jgi:hypothetical protein
VFVYVRRSLEDVALSLLRARLDYYGDRNGWWSTYPPNYSEIKDLDFAHQIAEQVVALDQAYGKAATELDPALLVEVEYADMVSGPDALLIEIVDRLGDLYSTNVERVDDPPRLSLRTHDGVSEDECAILRALAEYSGGG